MQTTHIENERKLSEREQTGKIKEILLIDDDKDDGLSATLAQEGYDVIHCDAVQKAWGLVYPQRPHLIIMHLPDLDGAGLADLQECRALAEGVPIILATSARVSETRMKALQHQAVAILDLPLMPEAVREALHDLEIHPR